MTESKKTDPGSGDKFERIANTVGETAIRIFTLSIELLAVAWRQFPKRAWEVYFMLLGVLIGSYSLGYYGRHLWFLRTFFPGIFDDGLINSFRLASDGFHAAFCMFLCFYFVVLFYGLKGLLLNKKYQFSLDLVHLQNGKGIGPKVIQVIKKDDFRIQLVVANNGIGIERFDTKKSDLEACFRKVIDKVENGTDPSIVIITLSTRRLPEKSYYSDLVASITKPYTFLIGQSRGGIETKCIRDLPHMLIAGTTGGGKSVFFKQALLSMLEHSEHIQMYLLDLKGGLEMADFKSLPNVRIAKDESEAVSLLSKINQEMKERFSYLEKNTLKEIDPERDKKDIIIVGVDEASVLYGVGSGGATRNALAIQAREETDRLAKLSRAAGIHLILATQKVTEATIDTKVQENVLGRMIFRMNTLQGSMTVLGNKMAMELPDIKGRGIWTSGNKFLQVQAPFLEQDELEKRISSVKNKWNGNKMKNYQPMIEKPERTQFDDVNASTK